MTGRFARERIRHELVRREVRVLRTELVAPGMRRVTLSSDELTGFASPGPADHVKLAFPDGSGGAGAIVTRDYTPLAFRAGADGADPELDVDFYLHGDEADGAAGSGGPAARWAASAAPGDAITVMGPRGSALPPADIDELILVADESALPSAVRWLGALETIAPAAPVLGLFSVDDPATADYLRAFEAEGRELRWFSGEDRDERVGAALREARIDAGTFCFLAGEASALVPLRRFLRRELGLPKEQVDVHGYWKRGISGHDHHAPVDPSDAD